MCGHVVPVLVVHGGEMEKGRCQLEGELEPKKDYDHWQ